MTDEYVKKLRESTEFHKCPYCKENADVYFFLDGDYATLCKNEECLSNDSIRDVITKLIQDDKNKGLNKKKMEKIMNTDLKVLSIKELGKEFLDLKVVASNAKVAQDKLKEEIFLRLEEDGEVIDKHTFIEEDGIKVTNQLREKIIVKNKEAVDFFSERNDFDIVKTTLEVKPLKGTHYQSLPDALKTEMEKYFSVEETDTVDVKLLQKSQKKGDITEEEFKSLTEIKETHALLVVKV